MAALLLAIVFVMGNFQLVRGRAAPMWDAQDFFTPAFTLSADHARAGHLVLWNPWQSGGSPDFAEPELGNASPITLLVGAILGGTEGGFRGYWLLIWFLGPLGMLLLARHLHVPPWAGFVVAMGFAFTGFYTSHGEHTSSLYSFSWLPFLVWRFDVALESAKIKSAAEAGALWGLSALGGYPQFTILTGIFLFLWAVGRCVVAKEDLFDPQAHHAIRPNLFVALTALAVVVIAGSVVLAPAYFAIFSEAGSGFSDRVGTRSREEAVQSNAIEPAALQTFASPYLTTVKIWNYKTLWPLTDISMTNVYVSGLVMCLALLAVISRPRSGWRWWLVANILFFLACSIGDKLPVRGWLYDYCPPTRYFRNPGLFIAYAMFCVFLLALYGARDLAMELKRTSARLWRRFVVVSLFATLCAVVAYIHIISRLANLGTLIRYANWHLAWTWSGCIAASVLLLLTPRSRRFLPLLLGILAVGDALVTSKISSPVTYSTGSPRQTWTSINALHNPSLDLTPYGLNRTLRPPPITGDLPNNPAFLGTNNNVPLKEATLINYVVLQNRFLADLPQHPTLQSMGIGRDRIWFAKEVATITPSEITYNAFVRRSESIGAPVLVVHPRKEMSRIRERGLSTPLDSSELSAISQLPPAQRISATVVRYTPNDLDLEVSCLQDGWLLVTDRWSSSWRARINGEPADVFGADFIFRAVRVKAGVNRIEFSFFPKLYIGLLILSWSTLFTILVLVPAATVWDITGKESFSAQGER
jgi:hypothetical protein